ncbi:MAG: hypothetical protein K0R43_405 [Pseudoduganella sp.]|jgi:flagellar biosynthetic protein FliR|nr:hypothetical protein [Pseudoduganella sp.]
MEIQVAAGWAAAVLLCSVRLAALLLATPLFDGFAVPLRVKLVLLLALAATLVSSLGLAMPAAPAGAPALFWAVLTEAALGAMLAFSIHTAFGAVALAGKLLDIQLGFGMANVYDPVTRSQSPLIGAALGSLALVLFFSADAHHLVLRGVAYSLAAVPLGALLAVPSLELVLAQFGQLFILGLGLAAPVFFCLFLLEAGLAVISRNLPQMNVFIISVPVKIMAGLAMLALAVRHMQPLFERLFASIFTFWQALL